MSQNLFIPVILRTIREGRQSKKVANFVFENLQKRENLESVLVDPKDFDIPFEGGKNQKYSEITAKADGFIFINPEYNHSFPASLKNLVDSELANYNHKAVAFVGVSAGPWGGTRGIQSMVQWVRELGLVATAIDLEIPFVQKVFDDDGVLLDQNYIRRFNKTLEELIWMARTLKEGRLKTE